VPKLLVIGGVIVCLAIALVYAAGKGTFGEVEHRGEVVESARSAASIAAASKIQQQAAREVGVHRPRQILFGDLHVHTTFSFDAFTFSLPMMVGEGGHPPADACDFARHCSALDFWSINDHAMSITPRRWRETVESIRQCNANAGDAANPDLVSFLGWEWTQVGTTPEDHYGHKNVVLAHTEDDAIPARPIAALRQILDIPPYGLGLAALLSGGRMHDFASYLQESRETPFCADEGHVRDLPTDCIEAAPTPADLYRKLDEWGHDAIVIPHGTTWGFYSPPGSTWDKQLVGQMHDPDRQTLLEVYSGHGDSEEYRDWRAVDLAEEGAARCPAPSDDYLPTCWRAGEIIRERCRKAGMDEAECESRAVEARSHAAAAGVAVHRTVPGSTPPDFLDAGQCLDCRQPSFNYRPGGSAQYILALGNFDEDAAQPRHFRMGLMASSDNHFARPGTGYKEVHRIGFTESVATGEPPAGLVAGVIGTEPEEPEPRSRPYEVAAAGFDVFETERQASFLGTGGLIGVHATGRDRGSIWSAMEQREVYGTSGPRILMWFDLLNPPGSRGRAAPMGSAVAMADAPIFRVRAVGSFEQRPGCPDTAGAALGAEDLERICKGECYHPSDQRRVISRVEIVRIRPQQRPDEDVAGLIDDPWRSFACDPDPGGCAVTVSDPEFAASGREALYYARAFEEPAPAINAANVRCDYDEEGRCLRANLCPGPDGVEDDCLASDEPRAWSSPIWIDVAGPRGSASFAEIR
jgi:hypothetical protein